jgi:uncharacterized protein involved in response to NO
MAVSSLVTCDNGCNIGYRKMNRMAPLLTAGFRPFFLAAAFWSVFSLAIWLPLLLGQVEIPSRFDPLSWHIHEMLFGFVMAGVGGFLLTAIPNWTGRPPVSGLPLGILVALWGLGRIACLLSALLPGWLTPIADLSFPIGLEIVAARELFTVGNRRNYPLLAPVILLAIANLLTHLQVLGVAVPINIGWRLAIAVIIMLISVIGGRIIPTFTRNWLNSRGIAPVPPATGMVDRVALGTLHAGMIAWVFLPGWPPIGGLLLIGSAMNAVRLARWRGIATRTEPLLLILHVGYLWLVVGVALLGLSLVTGVVPGAAAVHALTAGTMGTMILAVMTRATLGHTGRELHASVATLSVYALVILAAVLRVAAAWTVDAQVDLLEFAAAAWVGAFALFAVEYGPMLLAPSR